MTLHTINGYHILCTAAELWAWKREHMPVFAAAAERLCQSYGYGQGRYNGD